MKKWIKNKLRKILEIESLEKSFLYRNLRQYAVNVKLQEEINNASKKIQSLEKSFLDRNTYQHAVDAKLQEEINNASQKIQSLEKTIKNTLSLTMDINQNRYDPTWAIICYKRGGKDIVHHINLGNADGQEIRNFLKSYQGYNQRVDSPPVWGFLE